MTSFFQAVNRASEHVWHMTCSKLRGPRTLHKLAPTVALVGRRYVALEHLRERHGRFPCEQRRTVAELLSEFPTYDDQRDT